MLHIMIYYLEQTIIYEPIDVQLGNRCATLVFVQ